MPELDCLLDRHGVNDFTVDLNTKANTATLAPHTPRVLALERVYRLEREKVVRVRLRR
jgi:hypothetical protein